MRDTYLSINAEHAIQAKTQPCSVLIWSTTSINVRYCQVLSAVDLSTVVYQHNEVWYHIPPTPEGDCLAIFGN